MCNFRTLTWFGWLHHDWVVFHKQIKDSKELNNETNPYIVQISW
jgi:hypothetical protein